MEILREIAIGGLAGMLGGILVGGIGGRIFMRVAAAIDPTALGLITSNGNRIGDITLEGSVALVLLVGPLIGVFGAVVWVVASPWLPARGVGRALASGLVAVCTGSFFIVRGDEPDFALLDPTPVIVGLLVGLIGVLGIAVASIDGWLRRRLPGTMTASRRVLAAYGLVVAAGALFVPALIASYFSTGSSTFRPPAEVGLALFAVGGATLAWWGSLVRDGIGLPPRGLLVAGRTALALVVILGALKLATEISAIVDAPVVR